ncbi:TPA: phospholipase D-like domain-containing protein [Vibrio parahaemolyticus]|nr:phospholipase D family protein [Vibrio parahaemolyticus]HCH2082754.1 phospholipase D family protein [Vibrio parahaemolyticus]
MKVISDNKTLEKTLISLISNHEQVSIAVAWASAETKVFNAFLANKTKICTSTIGTHFYQTDPRVLKEFIGSKQVHFVTQTSGVFHPKVYLFRTGLKWEAIIGSSNMTNGAFTSNNEINVHLSSKDDEGNISFDELLAQLSKYFEVGVSVDEEYVNIYKIYHKKQKLRLDKLADRYGKTKASKPLLNSVVMQMEWPAYLNKVQQDVNHAILTRLELLETIRSYFNTYDDYKSMPLAARKTIAGLPNDVHKHWGWFGSMKGAGVYHSNINNNNEYISEALEHIPLCGEISISQYNQYVETFKKAFPNGRDGISIASRLLAMKRPDFFVCIDSKNNRAMCADFGIKVSGMTYERYWDELISRIHESVWFDSQEPSKKLEKRVWRGRVALLDCIFYEEE